MLLGRKSLRFMLAVVVAVGINCFEALAARPVARISGSIAASYDGSVVARFGDAEMNIATLDAHCYGGRFEVEVPVEQMTEVMLCAGGEVLARLLVAPEQKASVEFIDGTPHFAGANAEINSAMNNYLRKMNFRSFTPSYRVESAEQFVAVLDRSIEIERGRMLRELGDAPALLQRWAEREIRYRNAGYAVEYLRRNSLTDSVSIATLYDKSRFPFDHDELISTDYVEYVANVVRDSYIECDRLVGGLRAQRDYAGAYVAAIERVAKTCSSSEECDMIGTMLLNMSISDTRSPFAEVMELIHDRQLLSDEVIARFDAKRRGRADMRRFTEHTFERLLAESRSKVIYVDVWATWCPPCLREMKHLRKMEKRLENEPIRFVSLCVSSPYAQWALMVDLPDNRAANYWLDDRAQAELDRYIRVRSFPRFFVLSGGEIVNDNVQWPSSNKLIDSILRGYVELLNQSRNE
ncbi:MAG: TlpA family protein disulfide reductase [Rikenellaceae bacterium]|nr:TlpA family protein disulfide reductase [Rikenellaceae bacterium]